MLDGLTLDVSGILARSGTMSFRITDISGGTLEGLSSAEDFSLAEAAHGWNVLDYDASTGIVTLSVPEPSWAWRLCWQCAAGPDFFPLLPKPAGAPPAFAALRDRT